MRGSKAYWEGELSSSALSTATALTALTLAGSNRANLQAGYDWLLQHQNADGGWGDTVRSYSNPSTTALCWAALGLRGITSERAENWIRQRTGSLSPEAVADSIIRRYGNDRTFSVPILTMCALSGKLGPGPESWREVIQLPFELAAFPPEFFSALRLPVVSYALPALIAIGLVKHKKAPTPNALLRCLRNGLTERTLKLLHRIQPTNGGFLEATPLTSFVLMSLAGAGLANIEVAKRAESFLVASQRQDGSWPIDTNLETWVTTLTVNSGHPIPDKQRLIDWLVNQQYKELHLYTNAPPGGWAWTSLPGGVPDADDTAGALLALQRLGASKDSAALGVKWLLGLQNADGGIPTFCRGWGELPFDRSAPDLTAHAIRAWSAWLPQLGTPDLKEAIRRACWYLAATQQKDGSWLPLWFGNQDHPNEENPVYGTSKVLQAIRGIRSLQNEYKKGVEFLTRAAPTLESVEELSLAVEAVPSKPLVQRLCDKIEAGNHHVPSPIGFYFAKLWYFEKMYPLIFARGALSHVQGLHLA